jgi:hypothetical protein
MGTILHDTYQTDGSGNMISINVQIGFDQQGSTSVSLNGRQVIVRPPADPNGNYANNFIIDLDTNANLSGKLLTIVSNVDILMAPTSSSVTIELDGGAGPHQYSLSSGAGASVGDVITYFASITFI